jgi:hypothetical protein
MIQCVLNSSTCWDSWRTKSCGDRDTEFGLERLRQVLDQRVNDARKKSTSFTLSPNAVPGPW